MLDFISNFFKSKNSSEIESPKAESIEAISPQKTKDEEFIPETKQQWNYKLGVYDTPLYGCEQIVLHGSGMEHRMDDLMALAEENTDFTCTKKEMKDFLIINRRVYQYNFHPTEIDLVPEPENPYDVNAVKIILNNHHVGYVRASDVQGSVDLFNSERVKRVQVSVQGGKYKTLLGYGSFFDGSEKLSEFKLEKDEVPFSIKIYLDVEKA